MRECLGPNEQTLVQLANPLRDLKICQGTDWAAVDTLAHKLGLVERLGSQREELLSAGVPLAWIQEWAQARRVRAACNLLLAREEMDLLKALHSNGIEAIPLKGVSLAEILYGDLSKRPVTDIDLGIPLRQMVRAADTLEQRGYTIRLPRRLLGCSAFLHSADEHTAEVVCTREQADFAMMVELHWKVLPLPEDIFWSSIYDYGNSTPARLSVRSLAPDLYLLFLCEHVSGHGWTSLRWLCDVADFLLRFSQKIDPVRFLQHCSAARLNHRTGSTLELVEAYFGLRWEGGGVLRNSRTRRTAEEFLLRPLIPALNMSVGAIHRERLGLLDSVPEQLRYLWWLTRPTRTELVSGNGAVRSRPRAWLLRAARLAHLVWSESFSHRQQTNRADRPLRSSETVT